MRRSMLLSPELGDALSWELVPACMHAHENLTLPYKSPWERGTSCIRSRSL